MKQIRLTVIGPVGVETCNGALTGLFFEPRVRSYPTDSDAELCEAAFTQLGEYFAGTRRTFNLPLRLSGTLFQMRVWDYLRQIPYGQVATYGEVARAIGDPGASRAVGMANNRNPLPIVIPCHRVIGSDGGLTGYAGGLSIKRQLLELEGILQVSLI